MMFIGLGEYISFRLMLGGFECNSLISIIILFVITVCFIIFTFNPPKIGLFKDPVTKDYGLY